MSKHNETISIAISLLATIFSPILGLLVTLAFFSLTDYCMAIWRVVKTKGRIEFFKGVIRAFSKFIVFSTLIVAMCLVDYFLINELSIKSTGLKYLLSKIMTLLLLWYEFKSISRSLKEVKGVSLWELFTSLIRSSRDVIEKSDTAVRSIKNIGKIVLISFLVTGCLTVRNADRKHTRIVKNFPFVHTTDSVTFRDTIRLTIDRISKDTVLLNQVTTDTVILTEDRLKIRYLNDGKTVYLRGDCDSIQVTREVIRNLPVKYYEKPLEWWQNVPVIFGFCLASLGAGYFLSKKNNG